MDLLRAEVKSDVSFPVRCAVMRQLEDSAGKAWITYPDTEAIDTAVTNILLNNIMKTILYGLNENQGESSHPGRMFNQLSPDDRRCLSKLVNVKVDGLTVRLTDDSPEEGMNRSK